MSAGADSCYVVETDCEAPPALVWKTTRCRCFACGLFVCRKYSVLRRYLRYGRRRLCNPCAGELARDQERRKKR